MQIQFKQPPAIYDTQQPAIRLKKRGNM